MPAHLRHASRNRFLFKLGSDSIQLFSGGLRFRHLAGGACQFIPDAICILPQKVFPIGLPHGVCTAVQTADQVLLALCQFFRGVNQPIQDLFLAQALEQCDRPIQVAPKGLPLRLKRLDRFTDRGTIHIFEGLLEGLRRLFERRTFDLTQKFANLLKFLERLDSGKPTLLEPFESFLQFLNDPLDPLTQLPLRFNAGLQFLTLLPLQTRFPRELSPGLFKVLLKVPARLLDPFELLYPLILTSRRFLHKVHE